MRAAASRGWALGEAAALLNRCLHLVQCQLPRHAAGQGVVGYGSCSGVLTATVTPMGVCGDLQHLSVCLSLPADVFVLPWRRVALVALVESSAEKLLLYLH